MRQLYDKNKRPIKEGDVLKVFHFTGARNQKMFMYKIAGIDRGELAGFCASDLLLEAEGKHRYNLSYNSDPRGVLKDTEIVQSGTSICFTDREKLK